MSESGSESESSPQASVVMPVFKGEKYLKEALESVEKEVMGGPVNTELVVVLDGDGKDEATKECYMMAQGWRARLGDDRMQVNVLEGHGGQAVALNRGIVISRGRYTIVMNQDDLMLPDRIERQVAYLQEHGDVALIGGQYVLLTADGKPRGESHLPLSDKKVREIWLTVNPFAHAAVAHRRDDLLKIGGYRQDEWPATDLGAWYRLGLQGKVENLPFYVLGARLHPERAAVTNKALMIENVLKVRLRAMHEMGYHFTRRDVAALFLYSVINRLAHVVPPEELARIPGMKQVDGLLRRILV